MAETRIALVTGANRGIGLEIVKQLSRAGLMSVLGSRDVAKGREAAAKLASEGLEPPAVELDVTNEQSIRAAVDEVLRLFGRIDVLVNNAGILREGFTAEETSVLRGAGRPRHGDLSHQHCWTLAPHPGRGADHAEGRIRACGEYILGGGAALRHGRRLPRLPHVEGGAERADARSRPPSSGRRRSRSMPCVRDGCAPIWAGPMQREASTKPPKPPSGWRRFPRPGRPAASSAIRHRSRGDRLIGCLRRRAPDCRPST